MELKLQKYIKGFLNNRTITEIDRFSKQTYSQSGEDIIINFIFEYILENQKPNYIDIGAHHPYYLSNTAFFYKKGSTGVCVEPDPYLFREISKERSRDICLNSGIGIGIESEADFYVMSERALNTFSKEEAERYVSFGTKKIEEVIKVPLISINEVIQQNFNSSPNFISLDVEGLDLAILQTLDFDRYRAEVFCIETITYREDKTQEKCQDIIDFMKERDYFVYADTYINTIFVDKRTWEKR